MDWGMVFVVVFMCLILIGGLARLLWAMLDEPQQHSQKAPPSRHAAALARIKEIEADALMPIEAWLEKEFARREEARDRAQRFSDNLTRIAQAIEASKISLSGDVQALDKMSLVSLACQNEAHLHCHAIALVGIRCRCDCHYPNKQIMHLATQQPVNVSLACELGNCGECYYVDGAKHCACGCHERLLEEP